LPANNILETAKFSHFFKYCKQKKHWSWIARWMDCKLELLCDWIVDCVVCKVLCCVVGEQTDRITHRHQYSLSLPLSRLVKLPRCSCYVALMFRQPCRMSNQAACQPSDSLELDIIVIMRTPIDRIARTYPATGSLAAYTR